MRAGYSGHDYQPQSTLTDGHVGDKGCTRLKVTNAKLSRSSGGELALFASRAPNVTNAANAASCVPMRLLGEDNAGRGRREGRLGRRRNLLLCLCIPESDVQQ